MDNSVLSKISFLIPGINKWLYEPVKSHPCYPVTYDHVDEKWDTYYTKEDFETEIKQTMSCDNPGYVPVPYTYPKTNERIVFYFNPKTRLYLCDLLFRKLIDRCNNTISFEFMPVVVPEMRREFYKFCYNASI
ncbi:hypothetical protein nvc2_038 [Namao virus]|nr:hypothetical protein nvc2_038 [Namao virus]